MDTNLVFTILVLASAGTAAVTFLKLEKASFLEVRAVDTEQPSSERRQANQRRMFKLATLAYGANFLMISMLPSITPFSTYRSAHGIPLIQVIAIVCTVVAALSYLAFRLNWIKFSWVSRFLLEVVSLPIVLATFLLLYSLIALTPWLHW